MFFSSSLCRHQIDELDKGTELLHFHLSIFLHGGPTYKLHPSYISYDVSNQIALSLTDVRASGKFIKPILWTVFKVIIDTTCPAANLFVTLGFRISVKNDGISACNVVLARLGLKAGRGLLQL